MELGCGRWRFARWSLLYPNLTIITQSVQIPAASMPNWPSALTTDPALCEKGVSHTEFSNSCPKLEHGVHQGRLRRGWGVTHAGDALGAAVIHGDLGDHAPSSWKHELERHVADEPTEDQDIS